MRTALLTLMVALPTVGVLNAAWCGSALSAFAKAVPRIASTSDLERFKRVVAHQMYAALAQLVLLGLPPVLYVAGVFTDALNPGDVVFILVPSAVIFIVAQLFRGLEARVKSTPTADDELRSQRDAVVRTWVRKPLPNW
jgi:hypothetical protein